MQKACIRAGKKILHHAQSQRLSETPWAGNQCDFIPAFPPFFNELRFINIKVIICYQFFKILMANSYSP